MVACMPEAHWRWIVVAGTSTGIPAFSAAVRAVFASALVWTQSPKMTSSSMSPVTPARFIASCMTMAASWYALMSLRDCPKLAIGVLHPDKITTSLLAITILLNDDMRFELAEPSESRLLTAATTNAVCCLYTV